MISDRRGEDLEDGNVKGDAEDAMYAFRPMSSKHREANKAQLHVT